MPQVIITETARHGIDRCRKFPTPKNPEAAKRASAEINAYFLSLRTSPEMGKPSTQNVELRQLPIPFGGSGYVVLYIYDRLTDQVAILAFRHQKEAGY